MIKDRLLDILFPERCIYCKKIGKFICEECLQKNPPESFFTKMKNDMFDYLFCTTKYQGKIKQQMHLFKFHEKAYLYKAFIEMSLRRKEYFMDYDLITYVPMHYKKEWKRGYNQSSLLAKELGKRLNIEVKDLLEKFIDNKVQSSLSKEEREKNVENVFRLKKSKEKWDIIHKKIILVDDIFTTGATVRACSKILKDNGVKQILVFTIAKVDNNKTKEDRESEGDEDRGTGNLSRW